MREELENLVKRYEKITNTKKEDQALTEMNQLIKTSTAQKNILETENLLDIIIKSSDKFQLKKRISLLSQFSFSIVK